MLKFLPQTLLHNLIITQQSVIILITQQPVGTGTKRQISNLLDPGKPEHIQSSMCTSIPRSSRSEK